MLAVGALGGLGRLGLVAAAVRQLFDPRREFFSNGEQGVWFDPSDLSTLFQDSAGTTPVTAVEQPVGFMLDKSGRGNHAFQTATVDRPILRNRYNLLTKTEQFDGAAWVKSQTVVSANAVIAPDGTLTADTVTITIDNASSYVTQQVSLPASTAFVFRVWVLKGTANGVTPSVRDATGASILASITPVLLAGVWQQVTLSFTTTASGTYNFWIGRNGTGTTSLWGASLVPADQSHLPYQRVNTATDYDSDPSKFPLYLAANGTNTWMQTNNIDFTGTDKVTVFAGVRKLSDVLQGTVVELSAAPSLNSFSLNAPRITSAPNFGMTSRGSVGADAASASIFPAQISAVLSGAGDISGDLVTLRVNGSQAAIGNADQGTGNFGNYPLYLFRRGGTILPFNGNFYGLVIRGALTSDPQTVAMERWLAPKTGVTL